MDVCILSQDGEILRHRPMQTRPEMFLQALAPSRADLVVAVACLCPWDWLADRWAREAMPCLLGHALSLQAMHGGQANNEKSDAQHMAVVLRGGLVPQADVSPAAMRATRALLRRRLPLPRTRAALLAPLQHTHRQDTLPEIGHKRADQANRPGVAERFPAPAVPKRMAGDLALIGYDAHRRRAGEFSLLTAAQQHEAQPLSWRQTVPGIGTILRLGRLSAMHDLQRLPRVPDGVASWRLVTGARASAGKRAGSSGPTMGHASLQGAFSEAAVRLLRDHPAGQTALPRWENKPGQGQALTVRAQKLARTVYDMRTRHKAFERQKWLQGSGSGARAPIAALAGPGLRLERALCLLDRRASSTPQRAEALCPAL